MYKNKVESSMIAEIAYDGDKQILFVTFNNGTTYKYDKVPDTLHRELLDAESIGKYFIKYVKNNYVCTKMED